MKLSPSYLIARAIMELSDTVAKPMHEWLAGERQYFLDQGYTDDEARAMAAATYVHVFGTLIHRAVGPEPDEDADPDLPMPPP